MSPKVDRACYIIPSKEKTISSQRYNPEKINAEDNKNVTIAFSFSKIELLYNHSLKTKYKPLRVESMKEGPKKGCKTHPNG